VIDVNDIHDILGDCLLDEEEDLKLGLRDEETKNVDLPDCLVSVEGMMISIVFMKHRVEKHAPAIKAMLEQLPDVFHESGGSFLAMCEDRGGRQWGEHPDCDALMLLGIAIGHVRLLGPRNTWAAMPGGMPYLKVEGIRTPNHDGSGN